MENVDEKPIPRVVGVAHRSRWPWRRLRPGGARAKRRSLMAAAHREAWRGDPPQLRPLAGAVR